MKNSHQHLEKLTRALTSLANIPVTETKNLYATGRLKTITQGDYFLRAGDVPRTFGFVSSGLFRYVYIDDEGRQFTKSFMPDYSFISSYSAMIQQSQSYFYIEALEHSEVIEFSYSEWLKLKESNSCWNRFLIKLLEKGYTKKETRERELLLFDAECRYQNFLNEYPTLETRVKQHMIASYLGITPESLSRIRKNFSKTNEGEGDTSVY